MHLRLPIAVFLCGMAVMIIELVGSRVVAPFLGTSTLVWTSLIGVILASLSVGYWLGGRIGDNVHSEQRLALIIFIGGVCSLYISFGQSIIALVTLFSPSMYVSLIMGASLLFAPAAIAFGMVSPYAARISITSISDSGKTIGNLSACSTVGSIVGTFLGGFVLVSYISTTKIFIAVAIIAFVSAILVSPRSKISIIAIAATIMSIILLSLPLQSNLRLIYKDFLTEVPSMYGRLWILDGKDETGKHTRTLANNVYGLQSGIDVDHPEQTLFGYTTMFDIASAFTPQNHVLILGGGALTYPLHLKSIYPKIQVDVVEIDPAMTRVGFAYFGSKPHPDIAIIHQDARLFLNANTTTYDAIFVDTFSSHVSIPVHLTTQEAVAGLARSVAGTGVVVINVISALEGPKSDFLASYYKTLGTVFPSLLVYRVHPQKSLSSIQNLIIIASKQPTLAPTMANIKAYPYSPGDKSIVLIDDFAPIERMIASFQ